jgi:U3 small nucleolar RNA-associated protein 4
MSIELHRARFVEWTPASVVDLVATPDGAAVAVGREDGSVELYDVTQDWRCVARAPGCEGASLTALAWVAAAAGRLQLVSSSLGGQLVAWDFQALRPRVSTDSNGGPVWHIAAQPLQGRGVEEPQVRL